MYTVLTMRKKEWEGDGGGTDALHNQRWWWENIATLVSFHTITLESILESINKITNGNLKKWRQRSVACGMALKIYGSPHLHLINCFKKIYKIFIAGLIGKLLYIGIQVTLYQYTNKKN